MALGPMTLRLWLWTATALGASAATGARHGARRTHVHRRTPAAAGESATHVRRGMTAALDATAAHVRRSPITALEATATYVGRATIAALEATATHVRPPAIATLEPSAALKAVDVRRRTTALESATIRVRRNAVRRRGMAASARRAARTEIVTRD